MAQKCLVFMSILIIVLLSACSSSSGGHPAPVDQLTVAKDKLSRGALLVDVRSPEDYQLGHISGALNIPVDELGNRVHELGSNRLQAIVVYSDDDKGANLALNTLYDLGFENVLNAGAYEVLSEGMRSN